MEYGKKVDMIVNQVRIILGLEDEKSELEEEIIRLHVTESFGVNNDRPKVGQQIYSTVAELKRKRKYAANFSKIAKKRVFMCILAALLAISMFFGVEAITYYFATSFSKGLQVVFGVLAAISSIGAAVPIMSAIIKKADNEFQEARLYQYEDVQKLDRDIEYYDQNKMCLDHEREMFLTRQEFVDEGNANLIEANKAEIESLKQELNKLNEKITLEKQKLLLMGYPEYYSLEDYLEAYEMGYASGKLDYVVTPMIDSMLKLEFKPLPKSKNELQK